MCNWIQVYPNKKYTVTKKHFISISQVYFSFPDVARIFWENWETILPEIPDIFGDYWQNVCSEFIPKVFNIVIVGLSHWDLKGLLYPDLTVLAILNIYRKSDCLWQRYELKNYPEGSNKKESRYSYICNTNFWLGYPDIRQRMHNWLPAATHWYRWIYVFDTSVWIAP